MRVSCVEFLGDARAVGGARLELRTEASGDLPQTRAMRAPPGER